MKYTLTIREEAESDIADVFQYYEDYRAGLGHDFLLCVDAAIAKIKRSPGIYKKIYKNLRRIPIERFPYRIFFLIIDQNIIVTAVFHVRKDPKSWDKRT